MNLYENIEKAKSGNQLSKLELINKFEPLIKKYNRRYINDDIRTDLVISVLEAIAKIDLDKFENKSEGALVNYFSLVIKNTYIDLIKKEILRSNSHTSLNEDVLEQTFDRDRFEELTSNSYVNWLLSHLSCFQQEIMNSIYVDCKREIDIANEKNISKQSVTNAKRRSLKKLKEIFQT